MHCRELGKIHEVLFNMLGMKRTSESPLEIPVTEAAVPSHTLLPWKRGSPG